MENEVTIPVLKKYECPRCKRQSVAEQGSQLLCQPCVNEFLARNVGMMTEVVEDDGAGQVIPLDEPPVHAGPMPPDFLPGVEGPHGGGTG